MGGGSSLVKRKKVVLRAMSLKDSSLTLESLDCAAKLPRLVHPEFLFLCTKAITELLSGKFPYTAFNLFQRSSQRDSESQESV